MKILFVYSTDIGISADGLLELQEFMQFGISYLSSFLKSHGHSTELALLNARRNGASVQSLLAHIERFRPRVVCFTAVASQYDLIARAAADLRRAFPELFLLVGGAHATLNPGEVMAGAFDAVCVGEGELPTLELLAQLEEGREPSQIPNLWIRSHGRIEKNPPRPFVSDLDGLPFPDRAIWQPWMKDRDPERCAVLLSRGCPFDCSYCSNHALRRAAPGKYVRMRSPENIVGEIQHVVAQHPSMREVYLETEAITVNRGWCLALCTALQRLNSTLPNPLCFGTNVRVTARTDCGDLFAAMRGAGFRFVNIGLESGSERVRSEILRRRYRNDDVARTVDAARANGLEVAFFNLIGVPGETIEDFKETVRMNRVCKPDWHFTSIFHPYPGTDLYRTCVQQGLLRGELDGRAERTKAELDLPGFPRWQIQRSYRLFDWYVRRGTEPGRDRLLEIEVIGRALAARALAILRRACGRIGRIARGARRLDERTQ